MVKQLFLIILSLSFSALVAASERIVYHVHHTDESSLRRVITNLENLQQGIADPQLEIKLLLQGNSIRLLDPKLQPAELQRRFNALLTSGVEVEVEQESLNQYPELQHSGVRAQTLQSIFSRIIELQRQGYLYITP